MSHKLFSAFSRALAPALTAIASAFLLHSAAIAACPPANPQFHEGDIYILSQSLPSPPAGNAGVLRVNPNDGSVTQILSINGITAKSAFVFDTFRQKLIVAAQPTGAPLQSTSIQVDADGTWSPIAIPANINKVTTTQDGRLYYLANNGTGNFPLWFLDGAGVAHQVLDAAGTAQFLVSPGAAVYDMLYEPSTNSLWVATISGTSPCGTIAPEIYKVSLNAAGTQIVGSPQISVYCLGGFGASNFSKLSLASDGSVLGAVQPGSPQPYVTSISINPATMGHTVFSTFIDNVHLGSLTSGIYSNYLNGALFLDTFSDELRFFTQGSGGAGFEFATGLVSSAGGSGEICNLTEVRLGLAGVSTYGIGAAGCNGIHKLTANRSANINATDFRLICTNAPPNSLGLILIADAADPIGTDLFNLNFPVYLDLFTATQVLTDDIVSNPLGLGSSPVPIFIDPSLLGMTFYEQAIWYWSACSPPSGTGFSASNGLVTTILP